MRDYCIEMGLYFDEEGKLRRRVVRPQVRIESQLAHQSRRRGREFARPAHQQGKQAHEIDVVVALGAALAAVKAQSHTHTTDALSTRLAAALHSDGSAVVMTGGRTLWRASQSRSMSGTASA
jgi:hypothetical protein